MNYLHRHTGAIATTIISIALISVFIGCLFYLAKYGVSAPADPCAFVTVQYASLAMLRDCGVLVPMGSQ